jgi:carbon storage regulator CsrA
VAIEGNQVKLGIIADKDIAIIREEIIEAVKDENLSAGKIDDSSFDLSFLKTQTEQE